jgi:hypothetical protein
MTNEENKELKNKAELGKKITKMSKTIGSLKEDDENKFNNYSYISSNQMAQNIRDNLSEIGLAIIPNIINSKEEKFENGNKITIRSKVEIEFEIIDTETGYSIKTKGLGADQSTDGKSLAKAITEATKRFYFKLFNISSKEDIDGDSTTNEIETNKKNETRNETKNKNSKIEVKNIIKNTLLEENKEISPEELEEMTLECAKELINQKIKIKTEEECKKILEDEKLKNKIIEKVKEWSENTIPF